MIWAGRIAHMEEDIYAYRFLVGQPERKRLLEGPRCRCEDSIKMDLREIV
jgi:hypothetical protein